MRIEYMSPVLSGLASLQDYAQQWYMDKALRWPTQPPVNKIDIHHHFVPDFYAQGTSIPSFQQILSRLLTKSLAVEDNGGASSHEDSCTSFMEAVFTNVTYHS